MILPLAEITYFHIMPYWLLIYFTHYHFKVMVGPSPSLDLDTDMLMKNLIGYKYMNIHITISI